MTFGPGSVVAGRYHADRLVGQGGMGEVWVGENVAGGERVALKRLLPAASKHHEVVARFRREAVLLGKIQSEYVARVIDFVDDQAFGPVLIMEYIDGPSLAHILEDRRLTVEEAVDLVVDLALALCDLHDAKIVHRDLKPGNIIMRPEPTGGTRAIIVDFGIGKQATNNEDEVTALTRANIALGTVEYMAPEQILNSRDVTPTTDLYAIGAILYRSVAGIHAFGVRRGEELARAKLIEDPPRLEVGRKDDIARGLADVVAKCLKKRPAQRYASARDLLATVKKLQERVRIAELDLDSTTEDGSGAATVANREVPRELLAAAMPPARKFEPVRPAAGAPPPQPAPQPAPQPPQQQARPQQQPPQPQAVAARPQPQPQPQPQPAPPSQQNNARQSTPPPQVSSQIVSMPAVTAPPSSLSTAGRGSMPSIPDPRASDPRASDPRASDPRASISGAVAAPALTTAGAPRASLSSISDSSPAVPRPPMASLPEIAPARPAAADAQPARGVSVKVVALAVLTAFAVGAALGLIIAPVAAGGAAPPSSASALASAPACPVCPATPSCAPEITAAAQPTPAGSIAPSASAVASATASAKPPPLSVGSSRVDLQACKLEYSIVSPK